MDAFVSRKRPRLAQSPQPSTPPTSTTSSDEESTEVKLALLLSVFPNVTQEALLDTLVSCGGSVEGASSVLSTPQKQQQQRQTASIEPATTTTTSPKKRATPSRIQTSLLPHLTPSPKPNANLPFPRKPQQQQQPLIRKGRTLHLYTPQDIATHTPCTIIHNFLPTHTATALLQELLHESPHFSRHKFQLFERTVQSPHSASVYVSTPEEYRQQTSEYTYGGTYRSNVRQITPHMRDVSVKVQDAVNEEIRRRIRDVYPGGEKLRYQSPKTWRPNAAFVNCYDGPAESVGFHSDELTYLGPRAVIGSLSLGVEREFRVRRVVADDDDGDDDSDTTAQKQKQNARADAQGQISIHLPHNSLLVMHAEMQEEWKHAITPAQTVNPHPVSGNRRINITYRWYRDSLHPRYTPKCRCGTHAILRCAQRKRGTRGRYMWMCYAGFAPGGKGCSFFQWAEFDDDGEPLWANKPTEEQAPTLTNFVAS
ncbi:hypothetical protein SI65_08348 [Aspergillus cristatus]|uniref:Uncharacterized protein n=1 Tax=Aspergillus cristatus TaxID=573508 RepID=A0A1E3B628_ASPCR|nr:hypothetical protein SI65_08348 [Aspergillus cristatus]